MSTVARNTIMYACMCKRVISLRVCVCVYFVHVSVRFAFERQYLCLIVVGGLVRFSVTCAGEECKRSFEDILLS